jgi:hypothetical protein
VSERKRLPMLLAWAAAVLALPLVYVNFGPSGFFVCVRGALGGHEPGGLGTCFDLRFKILLALAYALAVVVVGRRLHRRSADWPPQRYRLAIKAYGWLGFAPLALISLYTLAMMLLLYEKLH